MMVVFKIEKIENLFFSFLLANRKTKNIKKGRKICL